MGGAYPATGARALRGFSPESSLRAAAQEVFLASQIQAPALNRVAEQLAAQPAVAGTESMRLASAWLRRRLESWGLRSEVYQYEVFLPHARRATLERIAPSPRALELDELALAQDADATDAHYPAAAGYSAGGDVTAPVVYANYGRAEDFARLQALAIETRGRVALIRHGQVFRGAKVKNAESAGAAAVILYSDPADDGYRVGSIYPMGPFRPPTGIQRGSVRVGPPGDPTTPGWPSLPGTMRRAPQVPSIPVIAAGYAAADQLLRHLGGPAVPQDWQGGLPLRYRTGDDEVLARVRVELDSQSIRSVFNTVAYLDGARRPDEWVIVGAHRDSWTNGALDNVSGTASVLEAARAMARLSALGQAPDRTIAFAFWDAEEWGLIGSAEWVEHQEKRLLAGAVAYINQDSVAGGPHFGAVASPSLRRLLLEVADAVSDPVDAASSVLESWRRRRPDSVIVPPPGAGSDYASFAGRLGIPSMGYGFGGPNGVYHSAYDTSTFVRRFGDPGYRQHRAASVITALAAWRLANADVVATDFVDLAREARTRAAELALRLASARSVTAAEAARLQSATQSLLSQTQRFSAASVRALEAEPIDRRSVDRFNGAIREAWRSLSAATAVPDAAADPAGVWFRNPLVAPDLTDAYRALWFPSVLDALAMGDENRLRSEIDALATRLSAAASGLGGALRTQTAGGRERP